MVYNAMKLFMEINPQLFDDCSHEYTEQQNTAAEREAIRERKWAALDIQANSRRASISSTLAAEEQESAAARPAISTLPKVDEADPATEDNEKRLDSLRLQDASGHRPSLHERQGSTSSAKSR